MKLVEIYTSPLCGYCHAAKHLLQERAVAYTEFDVWSAPERKAEMVERTGGRSTVPQIFIDGHAIGGCDELHALDRTGELARMLDAGSEQP